MEVLKEFGEFIRTRRKALNLTQAKLAELCDLSTRQIVKIESGTVDMRFVNLVRLCTVCKINIGELSQFYSNPYEDEDIDIYTLSYWR